MQFRLKSSHRSIKELEPVEFGNLSIVTGLNGSGKTHLLEAIENGSLESDLVPPGSARLVRLETIKYEPEQPVSVAEIQTRVRRIVERSKAPDYQRQLERYLRLAESLPFEATRRNIKLFLDGRFAEIPLKKGRSLSRADINNAAQWLEVAEKGDMSWDDEFRRLLISVAEEVRKPVFLVTSSDIERSDVLAYGESKLFQHQLVRLMTVYKNFWDRNEYNALRQFRGDPKATSQSYLEFTETFGPPPWTVINGMLEELGLPVRLNVPDNLFETEYQVDFRSVLDESAVLSSVESLSSGERVLFSIAVAMYYSQHRSGVLSAPRLLLLDEIDAHLHPSMARILIQTLKTYFVENLGMKVILTTHAPSTVALAPEDACFLVTSATSPRLTKATKQQALTALTVGVPNLSINFDGRRQVFVESNNDAFIYDLLYQRLKSDISSERTLSFIGVGHNTNGGSSQVKRMVQELTSRGNKSVFGVLDHDINNERNIPEGNIHVLACGRRDGLENVLFDPLLILAALVRVNRPKAAEYGFIEATDNYISLSRKSLQSLQDSVHHLTKHVLGISDLKELDTVHYRGNFTLSVDTRYLRLDDHELAKTVIERLPELNAIAKRDPLRLQKHIAQDVLLELPDFLPLDFQELFSSLVLRESS